MPHRPSRAVVRHPAGRFLIAGGLNTVFCYLLFRVFLSALAGRPAAAGTAQAMAYATGVAVGYVVNRAWTFQSERGHAGALLRFLASQGAALALSTALVQTGTSLLGLGPTVSWALATGATTVANYLTQRFWVFPEVRTADV